MRGFSSNSINNYIQSSYRLHTDVKVRTDAHLYIHRILLLSDASSNIGESTYLLLHRGIQIVVCLLIATSLIDEWTGHLIDSRSRNR